MTTVGELKKFLETIPDETLLGGSGHFGEKLDFNGVELREVYKEFPTWLTDRSKIKVLCFSIESPGDEPE